MAVSVWVVVHGGVVEGIEELGCRVVQTEQTCRGVGGCVLLFGVRCCDTLLVKGGMLGVGSLLRCSLHFRPAF